VGAVARLLHNFAGYQLVIIDPLCDHISMEAQSRAKHGESFLQNAKICTEAQLDSYDYLIATTSRTGSSKHISRTAVLPNEISSITTAVGRVGVIFGNEGKGLPTELLHRCDTLVNVPCNGALNLSHAVAILLYSMMAAQNSSQLKLADAASKKVLFGEFERLFSLMDFPQERMKETQRRTWKRVLGRSAVTDQEIKTMISLLKRVLIS